MWTAKYIRRETTKQMSYRTFGDSYYLGML